MIDVFKDDKPGVPASERWKAMVAKSPRKNLFPNGSYVDPAHPYLGNWSFPGKGLSDVGYGDYLYGSSGALSSWARLLLCR